MAGRHVRFAIVTMLAAAAVGLAALGAWQLERREWKRSLIAAVDARIHREPVAAPGPADWKGVDAVGDAYRRVRLEGRWLTGHDTFVQATTVLGSGYWLLAPLASADGSVTLVNRGFVSTRAPGPAATANEGAVTVVGLLRISEPGGPFPRRNDPAADRWYSRDVQAIAERRGLRRVAPYFVDAEAPRGATSGTPRVEPVAGLTVVSFRNDHLTYAITWFVLAAMVAGLAVLLLNDRRPHRDRPTRDALGH